MHMTIKKNDFICIVSTIFLVILASFHVIFVDALIIWLLGYSILKIAKTKNNILLMIQLFMLIYSIIPVFYFILNIFISPYQHLDVNHFSNMRSVLQIQSIFIVFFLTWAPTQLDVSFSKVLMPQRKKIAWLISLLIMIGGFAFVEWKEIIVSMFQQYSINTTSSIIFDYFMVFSVVNFCFCDKKWKKYLNILLNVVVSLILVILGKRLTAITILMLVYILFFDGKLKKKTILVCFFLGIMLFNSIQFTRVNQIPTLLNVLTGTKVENGILQSNACDIWYASEVIVKLITENIFDWEFRIKSFLGTFLNAFLTTNLTPEEALVNIYITENRLFPYTANGGFIGVSTYLWFGYPSVVLFAYIINKLIIKGMMFDNRMYSMYSALVLATFPRWYTYNPRILFKFAFVCIIVYTFVKIVSLTKMNNTL